MGTKDGENDELNTMVDDYTSVMLENKMTYYQYVSQEEATTKMFVYSSDFLHDK